MKEEIVNILKDGEKSTSQIASDINRNYYDCVKILEELENDGIIEKINMSRFTFWKLKVQEVNNG